MKKVLLVNPPYYDDIFAASKMKAAVNRGIIVLGLASLAGVLKYNNHLVKILDLNLLVKNPDDTRRILKEEIKTFEPDYAGITFTTPLVHIVKELIGYIREDFKDKVKIVVGGPHATALPGETIKEVDADYLVSGEGEYTLLDIVNGKNIADIEGLAYRGHNGQIIFNPKKDYITDLDSLPFPALDLFDIPNYTYPRIISRKNPVASMETSRGCFSRCVFCNKNIFGYNFRYKTPLRVVEEMCYILKLGFKEIHIVDDGFTTDIGRALDICNEILKRGLKFPWYVRGGIRVDRVNEELLKLMKRAGCYRVPFGIETGDPQILKNIKKGITIEQVRNAVKWAKKAGMIVDGYFMLGLPGETRESVQRTIEFACSLDIDYAKFAITVPLPGTEYFSDLVKSGKIKTYDWSKFNFASSMEDVYQHDLPWKYLKSQYEIAYRRFYYRPTYILKKVVEGFIKGEIFAYIEAFAKMKN